MRGLLFATCAAEAVAGPDVNIYNDSHAAICKLSIAVSAAQVVAGLNMELVFTAELKCAGETETSTRQLRTQGFLPLGGGPLRVTSVSPASLPAPPPPSNMCDSQSNNMY